MLPPTIPLFPLPNVVLFPSVFLPLHIFEPRYRQMVEDALYQFRFNLNDAHGRETPLEVGAHLLWQDAAHASGQRWSGFRFITVPDEQMRQLREWIDGPGGQFE